MVVGSPSEMRKQMTLQQLAELVSMAETHCNPTDTVQLDADAERLYVTEQTDNGPNVTAILPGYAMQRIGR